MTNFKDFIKFFIGNTKYGIELSKIREIKTFGAKLTKIPNVDPCVLGLLNLRGEVVPIIDLRIFFLKNTEIKYIQDTTIIALQTDDKRTIGIVIDKMDDVTSLNISTIHPPKELSTSIPIEYIKGYVKNNESEMIVILNIDNLLDKEKIKDL